MAIPEQLPQLVDSCAGRIVIDHGHFEVFDPLALPPEGTDLFALAEASPPSSSADGMAVILSPHQNNFDTSVTIEFWSARPDDDRNRWEQTSENVLRVESGTLVIGSPGYDELAASAAPDTYILEVSGRGFVGYGWPGSTDPGDEWRLRLWPERTDTGGVRAPQRWHQPGVGAAVQVPFHSEVTNDSSTDATESTSWGFLPRTSPWDSVPAELYHVNGAVSLNEMVPDFIARLIRLPEGQQREIAWWCARRALELAGLHTEDYIITTMAKVEAGAPPPKLDDLFAWLNQWLDETSLDEGSRALSPEATWTRRVIAPEQHPYASGEVSRPHFALPTIVTVANADPLHAAVETLSAACSTYSDHAPSLIEQLKAEFKLSQK